MTDTSRDHPMPLVETAPEVPPCLLGRVEAVLKGADDELSQILRLKFFSQMLRLCLRRPNGDALGLGYLLVSAPLADQSEHFMLAFSNLRAHCRGVR